MDSVLQALREIRVPYALYEMDIHQYVKQALDANKIEYSHEAKLAKGCRIDYLVDTIGIEIKKGKPNPKQLQRQLERYLQQPAVQCMIVISWYSVKVPQKILGKPVELIVLSQLWGVSLP